MKTYEFLMKRALRFMTNTESNAEKCFVDHRNFLVTKQRLRSCGENVIHVLSAKFSKVETLRTFEPLCW